MDADIEDIRKLDEILKREIESGNNLQEEFDEFINCISDDEEHLEGFETEDIINFEEFDVNKLEEIASNFCNIDNINFSNDLSLVKYYLKQEEIKVINSCKDPQLKRMLILNRIKVIQLQNMHTNLYETLKKCTAYIKETEAKIKDFYVKPPVSRKGIIPRLGHPYFKLKNTMPCLPNSDTLRKKKNKELSIDYIPSTPRWTLEDQMVLNRAVIFNYYTICIEQLEKKLKTLNLIRKTSTDAETIQLFTSNIEKAEAELAELKNCKSPVTPPPLDCSDIIKWDYISSEDLHGRHSPYACKAFWNLYLHPSVNKLNWNDEENKAIRTLVQKHNCQNWDVIASELNTNRSGFSVCVHYHARLSDKFKRDRFDPEEDAFLLEVVESCRIGNYIPWTKVAYQFDNRSKRQIYHRYKYYLVHKNVTKGTFSEAEDVLLLCLINKYGPDFSICWRYMHNRSPMQLSHRYHNYLKCDSLNFGNWTVSEDKKILEHVRQNGPKWWGSIVNVLRRNRAHIRHRFLVISKWLENHPNQTIDRMPRRKQLFKQKCNLKTIRATAESFRGCNEVPSLETIKKHLKIADKNIVLKVEQKQKNHLIDTELIDFFQSTCKVKTGRKVTEESLQQMVDTIKAFLSLMEVTLEIPDDDVLDDDPLLDLLDLRILQLLKLSAPHQILIKQNDISLPGCSQNISYIPVMRTIEMSFNKFGFPQNQITLLPPNINTLVGLRSMLITYNAFKKKIRVSSKATNFQEAKSKITWSIHQNFLKLKNEDRKRVSEEQEDFKRRFTTLFKWPCLMSVVEPYENLNLLHTPLEPISEEKTEKFPPKVGRPRKDLHKINLMLKAKRQKALERQTNLQAETVNVPPKILNGLSALHPNLTLASDSYSMVDQQMTKLEEIERPLEQDLIYVKQINNSNYSGSAETVLQPVIVDARFGVSTGIPTNHVIKLKKINTPMPALDRPTDANINSRKRQMNDIAPNVHKIKIEEVEVKVETNEFNMEYSVP